MQVFDLKNKAQIKLCRVLLAKLYTKNRRKYIDLFFYEKDVEFSEFDLSPLVEVNILKRIRDKFRANVQVFPLTGRFICTDFMISIHKIRNNRAVRNKDDVWAILAYESPYISKKAIVKKGDLVLDLATGSGIIAIFCAEKARKVIATDINPRAINFARFNAILNNVENKIEFREGNLFEPVKGMRFDLIIWNGPTLAVPNVPEKYPTYCFGGPDGLMFTKKFIKQVLLYLTKKGKMQWLNPSLGTYTEPESLKLVRELWKNKKLKVIYEQRTEPSDYFKTLAHAEKRMIFEPLKGPKKPLWIKPLTKKEYFGWLDFLKKNGFTHIHAGMYIVYPNKKFKIVKTRPEKIFFKRMNQLPQEWHFLSYQRILQQLKICESY